MGHPLLRALLTPRFALPLAALAMVGAGWWGIDALRLGQQMDARSPTPMRLADAIKASKNHEIYVRLEAASLDCGKGVRGDFGRAFALLDEDGRIPAIARSERCETTPLIGVFIEPPYGIYGYAIDAGWNVTRGHLGFLDTQLDTTHAYKRAGVASVIAFFLLCFCVVLLRSNQPSRTSKLRALGFMYMALMPWLAYMMPNHVVYGVIPVRWFAASAALIGVALVAVPNHRRLDPIARLVS